MLEVGLNKQAHRRARTRRAASGGRGLARRVTLALLAAALGLLATSSVAEAYFYHFRDSSGADCGLVMTLSQSPSGLAANVSARSEFTCIPNIGMVHNQAELDSAGFFQVRLNPYPFHCINCGGGVASTSVGGINKGYLRFTSYFTLQTADPNSQWVSHPTGLVCEGIFYNTLKCLINENYIIN